MKTIFNYFVFSSWWVALCAAVLGLLTWFELTGNWWNAALFFFTVGSTLVIYNLNMLVGLDELREMGTHSERHHWCMNHEPLMKGTLVLGLIMAAVCIWFLNNTIWLFMIPLTIVALVYTMPIMKLKTQTIRVREIGLWKIFLIAAVWTGMTVILPAVDIEGLQQLTDIKSWWLATERAIFILAITIPFDIRDLVNDAKKGIRTIPSTIGWKRSIMLAEVLLAIFIFLVWLRIGTQSQMFIGYAICTIITMVAVAFANPNRNDMYCSFWIEGTMMLLFASIFLTS